MDKDAYALPHGLWIKTHMHYHMDCVRITIKLETRTVSLVKQFNQLADIDTGNKAI